MPTSRKRKYDYASAQTHHSFPTTALQTGSVHSVTVSDSVSADGRRLRRDTVPVYTPPNPASRNPVAHEPTEPAETHAHYEVNIGDYYGPAAQRPTKSKRNNYFISTVRLFTLS